MKMPSVYETLASMADLAGNPVRREREQYGEFALSIQAGPGFYCSPKTDGLPIEEYESVEVALCRGGPDGENCLPPRDAGFPLDLCDLFQPIDVTVAGYVSQANLQRMRDHLKSLMH